jgi:hypothetical protein
MSKEVVRYLVKAGSECSEMVYASDYDALLAERDALEAQVSALHRGIKAKLPGRSLVPVGSGALHAEQNYCYRRGWKDGVAALRSQIRAALQGAHP